MEEMLIFIIVTLGQAGAMVIARLWQSVRRLQGRIRNFEDAARIDRHHTEVLFARLKKLEQQLQRDRQRL